MQKKRGKAPKMSSDFKKVADLAKKVMARENISFDELEKNTGVDAQFCRILFDDATDTAQNISTIIKFLKISFKIRKMKYVTYRVLGKGSSIRVRRIKIPKCTMYYDRNTDNFFRFKYDLKEPQTEMYTSIIKNEMRDALYKYLEAERKERSKI